MEPDFLSRNVKVDSKKKKTPLKILFFMLNEFKTFLLFIFGLLIIPFIGIDIIFHSIYQRDCTNFITYIVR